MGQVPRLPRQAPVDRAARLVPAWGPTWLPCPLAAGTPTMTPIALTRPPLTGPAGESPAWPLVSSYTVLIRPILSRRTAAPIGSVRHRPAKMGAPAHSPCSWAPAAQRKALFWRRAISRPALRWDPRLTGHPTRGMSPRVRFPAFNALPPEAPISSFLALSMMASLSRRCVAQFAANLTPCHPSAHLFRRIRWTY